MTDAEGKNQGLRLPYQAIPGHHVNRMGSRYLVFAFFAGAMLFAILREQSAPTGCVRREVRRSEFSHR